LTSGARQTRTIAHKPGRASGTIEGNYAMSYPTGHSLDFTLTATQAGAPLATATVQRTAGARCDDVAVTLDALGGGSDMAGGGANDLAGGGVQRASALGELGDDRAGELAQRRGQGVDLVLKLAGRRCTAALAQGGERAPVRLGGPAPEIRVASAFSGRRAAEQGHGSAEASSRAFGLNPYRQDENPGIVRLREGKSARAPTCPFEAVHQARPRSERGR